jgi:beta-mannosidase
LACRPVLASARIGKFEWTAGEVFSAELWLLNDSPAALAAGVIEAFLVAGAVATSVARWEFPGAPAGKNLRGPDILGRLPTVPDEAFELRLQVTPAAQWGSTYRLKLAPAPP